MFLNVLGRHIF